MSVHMTKSRRLCSPRTTHPLLPSKIAKVASIGIAAIAALTPITAIAGPDAFSTGPVIEGFGPAATVTVDMAVPEDAEFKILLDGSTPSTDGNQNRTLTTAARFLNMHAKVGVKPEAMSVAVVLHGKAIYDVTKKTDEQQLALIKALNDAGATIYVCGQSAAHYGVDNDELAPGVQMALSAMTVHMLLQQQGYQLNPF